MKLTIVLTALAFLLPLCKAIDTYAAGPAASKAEMRNWSAYEKRNDWTDAVEHFADSASTAPMTPLASPYAGLEAVLSVRCDRNISGAFARPVILFSHRMHVRLQHVEPSLGADYMAVSVPLQWANQRRGQRMQTTWELVERDDLTLHFGFAHGFSNVKSIVWDLEDRDYMKIQLTWAGESAVFKFDTRGAAAAIRHLPCAPAPSRGRNKIRAKRLDAGDWFAGAEQLMPAYASHLRGAGNQRIATGAAPVR